MAIFNSYSTRAASASKTAFTSGSLKQAMDKGQWRSTSSFYRHYLRQVTYFDNSGQATRCHPTQPPQANLAPVTPETTVKQTAKRLVHKAKGTLKPATPVRQLPTATIKRTGPKTHVYATRSQTREAGDLPHTEPEEPLPQLQPVPPPSPAQTTAYDDSPPSPSKEVTVETPMTREPVTIMDLRDVFGCALPTHPQFDPGTPNTIGSTSDCAPNLQLTVDICDSISQQGSPQHMPTPSLDELPHLDDDEVANALATVSEHCYSNSAVLNPKAEIHREKQIKEHLRIHKDSQLMPPPPKAAPTSRIIFSMTDGDYLTYTKTGFEMANRDARTFPHGNATTVKMLKNFPIKDCRQMAINLADRKIRFTAVRIPECIYKELLDTNIFLMVCRGFFYMCCTSLDIAIFTYLRTHMKHLFTRIPELDEVKISDGDNLD